MNDTLREETVMKKSRLERVAALFPAGQIVRYLCVGIFNTAFAYVTFAVALTLLNDALPQRFLYLTVVLSSVIVTPLNITVAFLGYKFFVFRTKGNFVREWLKCFAVYGTGMIPGLIALSALTKLLQATFHRDSVPLHAMLHTFEQHLSGAPLRWVTHIATGKAMAGYIAGALMILFTTIYSFMGHKHVTFKAKA
ncbi:GtrA family protein [Granulicella paludicola]|uniref:GtrA family protein n=1 Tax=Granulicella paludicola TaxID=474951 RepID=UPI0021E0ECB8|nr:GtrA family protein [Granulicella paludicola]